MVVSINSKYYAMLINKISEVKEISYYELRKYFNEEIENINDEEIKKFNEELDSLEEEGIVRFEEGMIIYVGI